MNDCQTIRFVFVFGVFFSLWLSSIPKNVCAQSFTGLMAPLDSAWYGAIAWGDYDNDNDLDILLTGAQSNFSTYDPISKIYRNDNGDFVDIKANVVEVFASSVAWGDFDNDGDLDFLLTGRSDFGPVAKIYENRDRTFVDIGVGLIGVENSAVAWGDYDKDGDLDILLTGQSGTPSTPCSKIYRNDAGQFADIMAPLVGISYGSAEWGDYDNDGDLDILLTGIDPTPQQATKIYRNDDGKFTDSGIFFFSTDGYAAWGDYDNDGDLDILLVGWTGLELVSTVYRNDGGNFVNISATMTGVAPLSAAAWGDYDNDSDLDVLLIGDSELGGQFLDPISNVYRNNIDVQNTPPASPAELSSEVTETAVILFWHHATDAQTAQSALTYNLRVGRRLNGEEIISAMADAATGFRRIPKLGNVYHDTSWTIKNLPDGNYYWSVQAIDNAFAASEFAPEQEFVIGTGVAVHEKPEKSKSVPLDYELLQNFPNPFNPSTSITFGIPKTEFITVEIYNYLGERVTELLNNVQREAGYHRIVWNGRNRAGQQVASGVYVYRLQAGMKLLTGKMIFTK